MNDTSVSSVSGGIGAGGSGTGAGAPTRGSGRIWPVLIVGLLGMNAIIVAATVYWAVGDPSVVSEPDYYASALKYDEVIAQRGVNARLGWGMQAGFEPAADGKGACLSVRLSDADGRAIPGAKLVAQVFSNLRSDQRQVIKLESDRQGTYQGPVRLTRTGRWNIRIRAERGQDVWTGESEILVPGSETVLGR